MYTKSILIPLFLAAVGTYAAPALETRQADSVPLNIYNGDACRGAVVTTANIPKDGSCFAFSPIVSGQTDSGRIDVTGTLPTGCTLTLFNTANCSPQGNNIPVPVEHRCSTFGTGNPLDRFIRAAQLSVTFVRIKADGEWKKPLQYVRNKTSPYDELKFYEGNILYRYYNWPTYIIDRPESVRCGRDNMNHASETEVLTLKAGDTIEIAQQREDPSGWTDDMFYNCTDDRGTCDNRAGYLQDFNHPGPLLIHLSKVPNGQDIRTYDGSGEWVKIHTLGLINPVYDQPLNWTLYRSDPPHITFKIPLQTPPGQYLMRMDVIWSGATNEYVNIGDDGSLAQMYPSCAQLNIVSQSKAVFPKGVKIPETFQPLEPGMTTSWDMMNNQKLDKNYTYPGGPLWNGEEVLIDKPVVSR